MTIARQDNRDGVTMGRVVGAFEGTLRIKDPVSQRLHTVLRKHCRKTSVTQMRRKEWRANIPKSISIRWAPIQVTTRKVESQQIQESFVVPPSTKAVLRFMRQAFSHIYIEKGRAVTYARMGAV